MKKWRIVSEGTSKIRLDKKGKSREKELFGGYAVCNFCWICRLWKSERCVETEIVNIEKEKIPYQSGFIIASNQMADGKSFWHGANIETENNKTKD